MLNGIPPGYAHFHDPILKVLGKATENTPDVLVPFNDGLCSRVIQTLGFNPKKLSKYGPPEAGWCFEGKSKPAGFRRKVTIAYQDLHTRRAVPLTIKGKTGFWGLTAEGVQALLDLQHRERTTPNVTSVFLNSRLSESTDLMLTLRRTLGKHMPMSVASHQVEDHIQTCLMRLISRDALRTRILIGLPVKDHHIAQWALRSAYTDARDASKEPVTRELLGARSGKERAADSEDQIRVTSGPSRLVWNQDEDGKKDTGSWQDIVDTNSSMRSDFIEGGILFREMWSQVESKIRAWSTDTHLDVFKMRLEGYSVQEIADVGGIPKGRATTMLAEARKIAKDVLEREMRS